MAVVNSSPVNIGVHVNFWIMVFSGYVPRIGNTGSNGCSIFPFFLGSLHTVLHSGCTNLYSHQPCWRVTFSTFSLAFIVYRLFDDGHSFFPLFFNHSVLSNFLLPHALQHTRLPCPSVSPRACSNSCPLSWWCHPTISSFVIPFSCLQSFPESGSFLMSQFFASSGQSTGASPSASVLPMNIQDWFSLGLTTLISLQSRLTQEKTPMLGKMEARRRRGQ